MDVHVQSLNTFALFMWSEHEKALRRCVATFSRNTKLLKHNSLLKINKTNILFNPILGDMFFICTQYVVLTFSQYM
jgi:hypothetical protein